MERGIYEKLLSDGLEQVLKRLADVGLTAHAVQIDRAEQVDIFSNELAKVLRAVFAEAGENADGDVQATLYNSILSDLISRTSIDGLASSFIKPPPRQLRLVWPEGQAEPSRPDSPLAAGSLFTGTRLDPSLVSQLRKELETADSCDILCSFIKWGGIRVLEDELTQFTNRPGTSLRIITTSYLGATDIKAVEFLRNLRNTSVRVSYDTHRTRLHAKSYIIRRNSGFGSAYIGSANLSQAALTDGLEWTVKVSQYEQPYLWEKVIATFETHWNDNEFELYEAGDRERLNSALESERGGSSSGDQQVVYFDLRPYAFQQEILDKIQAERDIQKRGRHLIVAATGTGKTMVAAFDYRRWCASIANGVTRPRLLFVAHREEILKQSLATFRCVLRDQNFGDLLVGGSDLYNEGVDIPEIDTILLLRPTDSLTVYLQQLGRGLRLCDGKDCLTVLDFIGQAHKKYRFDVRFRAMLDDPTRNLLNEVEGGFAHLPSGCTIQLERVAKQRILDNITQAVRQSRNALVDEVKESANILGRAPTLAEFLEQHRLALDDIYRRDVSWSRLCTQAGVRAPWTDPDEDLLTAGLRRIQHVNSPTQIRELLGALSGSPFPSAESDERRNRLLLMSFFSLWRRKGEFESLQESYARLRANAVLCDELTDVLKLRLEQMEFEPRPIHLPFSCPLELHGAYTRDEILAGLGNWTFDEQPEMREGVRHLPALNADAFLFTLQKSDRDYSPTTMYKDYAISDSLFHWQSQSQTSVSSPTGQRYIHQRQTGHTILLFCREYKGSGTGLASPFYFIGPADYVSHEGSNPISITWRLRAPLPAKLYRRMARLAVG